MSVTINETNFPDEIFRQYISETFDTDNDGVLSDSELANAKEISIGTSSEYKTLASIDGINYFTSLEGIWLMYCTNITSVSISACPNLKHAVFEQCSNLATLLLTNCSDLEEINISGTKLSVFDTSNYAKLKKLNMANASISSISINPNAPLERLLINETSITSLVLGQRPYLTELQFFSTDISNIDISGCPNLKILIAYDSELESINISGNEYLQDVFYSVSPVKTKENNKNNLVYYSTETRYQLWIDEVVSVIDGTNIRITQQPSDQSVELEEQVTFAVVAVGENLVYRWDTKHGEDGDWSAISGATSSTYQFIPTIADDNTYYRCLITNDSAAIYSHIAHLHILTAPIILRQPSSITVYEGKQAGFLVEVKGDKLKYQWQYALTDSSQDADWNDLSNSDDENYVLVASLAIDGYWYRCKITNEIGSIISNSAQLHVEVDQRLKKPIIVTQPKSISVNENESATFIVEATGEDLSYQWQLVSNTFESIYEYINITDATESTYIVTPSILLDQTVYVCAITNAAGTVISDEAVLTVIKGQSISAPRITNQPTSVTVKSGSRAGFRVSADGGSLIYQWQVKRNGTWYDVTGETQSAYNFTARTEDNGLQYRCQIGNAAGTIYTTVVTLTIDDSSSDLPIYGYHSIIISGKNTYGEWEMYPTSRPHVALPEVKTNYVDLPGANGGIDYTELLIGEPTYGYRKGSWEFMLIPQQRWPDVFRSLASYLHGKIHTVVLEDDLNYEYTGRLSVNKWESLQHNSTIVIDYILEPVARNRSGETFDTDESDLQAATRLLRKSENSGKAIVLWNNYATIMPISEYFDDGDDISY